MTAHRTVIVAAAVILEAHPEGMGEGKRVLLSQRMAGDSLGGKWEFPGGKVEEGENPRRTVERELKEELDLDCRAGEILEVTFHRYAGSDGSPGKSVLLMFFLCTRIDTNQVPKAIEVADWTWADAATLRNKPMPEADRDVIEKVLARLAQ
jgi:8-oxo-dGTP diphosphatase